MYIDMYMHISIAIKSLNGAYFYYYFLDWITLGDSFLKQLGSKSQFSTYWWPIIYLDKLEIT